MNHMEKFSIKPSAAKLLRQAFFISLILPAMPFIVMAVDYLADRRTFNLEVYHEPYLYLSGIGVAIFLIMIIATIPALLKEKLIITSDNQLVFQSVFKKPNQLNIKDIIAIDRGWKQRGEGKIQVVNIYAEKQTITFELKKYQKDDIEHLISHLKAINNQINNLFGKQRSFGEEIKKYFAK